MDNSFMLSISTPEKQFYSGRVESAVIASLDGEIGIMPGHLSMVVALSSSAAKIKVDGKWRIAAVSGGFARIKPDNVIIMADTAEWPEEIEENRALEAKKRAEERLQSHLSDIEYMQSRVALERALMRLTVKHSNLLR